MERTPDGTPVGADDPYEFAGVCDHLTGDGHCRYALAYAGHDPEFAAKRRAAEYECLVGDADSQWRDCSHYRSTSTARACARCGLEEVRLAQQAARPLLESHHLSYPDGESSHEITVVLCRWCHSKVHNSWARLTDDVRPDAEALAAREARRSKELAEFDFEPASERFDRDG
ncbi:MAG: DUF7097 family protein [Halobacteriota archaeon]